MQNVILGSKEDRSIQLNVYSVVSTIHQLLITVV